MKQSLYLCCSPSAGFLFGFHFNPEGGGDMFLCNISWLSTNYIAFYLKGHNSSIMALISAGNPSILWSMLSPTGRSNWQGLNLGKYGGQNHVIKTAVKSDLILFLNQSFEEHVQHSIFNVRACATFLAYLMNAQLLSSIIIKQIGSIWYCFIHQHSASEIVQFISEDSL
jgi:hypothetical protein